MSLKKSESEHSKSTKDGDKSLMAMGLGRSSVGSFSSNKDQNGIIQIDPRKYRRTKGMAKGIYITSISPRGLPEKESQIMYFGYEESFPNEIADKIEEKQEQPNYSTETENSEITLEDLKAPVLIPPKPKTKPTLKPKPKIKISIPEETKCPPFPTVKCTKPEPITKRKFVLLWDTIEDPCDNNEFMIYPYCTCRSTTSHDNKRQM